jgi:hypothetical protein
MAYPQKSPHGSTFDVVLKRLDLAHIGSKRTAHLRHTGQFPGMALQFDQVVEGVCPTQLAGVDEAHEQIPDLRTVQGAIKQGETDSFQYRCFKG